MKKGKTYKHENCTDAAAEVLRIIFIPEKKGYQVKVLWINVADPRAPYLIGLTDNFFIPAIKIREWKEFSPSV